MSLCKHPEEVCCSMTIYHGKVYCDNTNGFCQLHDEPPPMTNADYIRSMTDEDLAKWLTEFIELTLEANDLDDDFKVADTFEADLLNRLKQPCTEVDNG